FASCRRSLGNDHVERQVFRRAARVVGDDLVAASPAALVRRDLVDESRCLEGEGERRGDRGGEAGDPRRRIAGRAGEAAVDFERHAAAAGGDGGVGGGGNRRAGGP